MKFRSLRSIPILAVAAVSLVGCATAPSGGTELRNDGVRVYAPADLSSSEYEVVRHLWVDNWSTALWMPTYPTEAEGIAAMQNEAASVGADGLINVYCVDRGRSLWSSNAGPALVCYASAIRVRRSPG